MNLEHITPSQKQPKSVARDEDLAEFIQLVDEGKRFLFAQVISVTPSIAKWLLDRNENNRKINKRNVRMIVSDIENGRWQVNGETIIVSEDGMLNDGQNRLTAVVQANKAVDCFVAFGVSRKSRESVDDGKPRSVGDFMQMREVASSRTVAAIVTLYELYSANAYYRSLNQGGVFMSKQEMLAAYEKRADLFDKAAGVARDKFLSTLGPSSIGAAYVILSESKKDSVDAFFDRLSDGAGLEKGNPILTLRNRLAASDERLFAHERLELILRAWNAYVRGEKLMQSPKLMRKYPELAK